MLWLMIIVGVVVVFGGILGGMGFFGGSKGNTDRRPPAGGNFLDWML